MSRKTKLLMFVYRFGGSVLFNGILVLLLRNVFIHGTSVADRYPCFKIKVNKL